MLAELAEEEQDEATAREVEQGLAEAEHKLEELSVTALFRDEYDASDALLSINAGAGGTEACDWVQMLARMYLRWAERHGYETRILDSTPGEQVGYKSVVIEIEGSNA